MESRSVQRQKQSTGWRIVGATVQGATHIHKNLPNQDAIDWEPKEGSSSPLVLAVSDGHGSKRYIRSADGSRLAVEAVLIELRKFHEAHVAGGNISRIKRAAEERLPTALKDAWKLAVEKHIEARPFTEDEYASLLSEGFTNCREEMREDPYRAYGATLLGALVSRNWLLFVQLGDGDILTVDPDGRATRPLPPPADEPIGEETHSLCERNAQRFFQVRVIPLQDQDPDMILVSTDGLNKSYSHDAGFLKVGSDLLNMVREEGIQSVHAQLPDLLNEVSLNGSGDDVSLGIIKRCYADDKEHPEKVSPE
jgi:hypothetical protein